MRAPLPLRLLWTTLVAWYSASAPRLGAALAYYTLFAMAPVLLVLIAIAGFVFGEEAVRGQIVNQISGLIGQQGAQMVQEMLQSVAKPRQGIIATIIGTITFLLAITGVFLELQAALNAVWSVKVTDTSAFNFRRLLVQRLRSLGIVVSLGFLLMVSLATSAAVAAAADYLGRFAPGVPVIAFILNQILSLSLSTVLFALLFRLLPDVKLQWRDVGVGAFVTALLFTIGQQLISLYLGRSSTTSAFGAAGAVILLLVWVYYSSQILLLGAEFTRVYTEHYGRFPRPESYAGRDHDAPERVSEEDMPSGADDGQSDSRKGGNGDRRPAARERNPRVTPQEHRR